MIRLALILYSLIATTLMGVFIIAVLTAGHATLWPIIWAAALGAVLAVPASLLVARQITRQS
ncbi:MAG: CTP synthetase [Rhodobacteraceae bacterium]|nr:CTP synthetase [Paracoccaceae bacterium]